MANTGFAITNAVSEFAKGLQSGNKQAMDAAALALKNEIAQQDRESRAAAAEYDRARTERERAELPLHVQEMAAKVDQAVADAAKAKAAQNAFQAWYDSASPEDIKFFGAAASGVSEARRRDAQTAEEIAQRESTIELRQAQATETFGKAAAQRIANYVAENTKAAVIDMTNAEARQKQTAADVQQWVDIETLAALRDLPPDQARFAAEWLAQKKLGVLDIYKSRMDAVFDIEKAIGLVARSSSRGTTATQQRLLGLEREGRLTWPEIWKRGAPTTVGIPGLTAQDIYTQAQTQSELDANIRATLVYGGQLGLPTTSIHAIISTWVTKYLNGTTIRVGRPGGRAQLVNTGQGGDKVLLEADWAKSLGLVPGQSPNVQEVTSVADNNNRPYALVPGQDPTLYSVGRAELTAALIGEAEKGQALEDMAADPTSLNDPQTRRVGLLLLHSVFKDSDPFASTQVGSTMVSAIRALDAEYQVRDEEARMGPTPSAITPGPTTLALPGQSTPAALMAPATGPMPVNAPTATFLSGMGLYPEYIKHDMGDAVEKTVAAWQGRTGGFYADFVNAGAQYLRVLHPSQPTGIRALPGLFLRGLAATAAILPPPGTSNQAQLGAAYFDKELTGHRYQAYQLMEQVITKRPANPTEETLGRALMEEFQNLPLEDQLYLEAAFDPAKERELRSWQIATFMRPSDTPALAWASAVEQQGPRTAVTHAIKDAGLFVTIAEELGPYYQADRAQSSTSIDVSEPTTPTQRAIPSVNKSALRAGIDSNDPVQVAAAHDANTTLEHAKLQAAKAGGLTVTIPTTSDLAFRTRNPALLPFSKRTRAWSLVANHMPGAIALFGSPEQGFEALVEHIITESRRDHMTLGSFLKNYGVATKQPEEFQGETIRALGNAQLKERGGDIPVPLDTTPLLSLDAFALATVMARIISGSSIYMKGRR